MLNPFLSAAYDCGRRFVAFAEKLKAEDADFMANLNYARNFEENARLALESAIIEYTR